jgi:hypothetical protein
MHELEINDFFLHHIANDNFPAITFLNEGFLGPISSEYLECLRIHLSYKELGL